MRLDPPVGTIADLGALRGRPCLEEPLSGACLLAV
jgi:hypothetical protein